MDRHRCGPNPTRSRDGETATFRSTTSGIAVHPNRSPEHAVDLKQLVDRLEARGIQAPVLIRFADILRDRLTQIRNAFSAAIEEQGYRGQYRCLSRTRSISSGRWWKRSSVRPPVWLRAGGRQQAGTSLSHRHGG